MKLVPLLTVMLAFWTDCFKTGVRRFRRTVPFFVVVTVLAFNFVGDGLRDAADPYK